MTARWALTFKILLAAIVVCAVGLLGCGFLSSRGNLWERLAIACGVGMGGWAIATYGLALVYYVRIRLDTSRRLRSRPPLSDKEFTALSPALEGVDPLLLNRVRETVAQQFRSIGGERFYPGDDLDDDLHLSDFSFWGEWLEDLAVGLGIEESAFDREFGSVPIKTYGDLVLFFDRLRRESRAKGTEHPIDRFRSHPVWDRALDG
jgi:hypothetical protein